MLRASKPGAAWVGEAVYSPVVSIGALHSEPGGSTQHFAILLLIYPLTTTIDVTAIAIARLFNNGPRFNIV